MEQLVSGRGSTLRRATLRMAGPILCVLVTVLATGCAAKTGTSQSTDTNRSTATTGPSATTATTFAPSAVICNGDNEVHQDDEGAMRATLQDSQLPGGAWTVAETPPCPWALTADEILAVPECREAATAARAPANKETHNGNGRVTFTRSDGVHLDDRIEIYTSRQNVDAIRAILASRSMPACYSAALQRRADAEPETRVTKVRVSRFDVRPDAKALHLGFPAAAGYAADPGFVVGVNITFTSAAAGSTTRVAMRVITFGSGGLMSTVTLAGRSLADLDAVDLTATLRHAAKNFTAITAGG